MHIISLTAENIKKLTAVQITPDGKMVEITGKNGQGKTAVLDCIWWALEGAKHIQARPIRGGQKKARIRLELGSGKTAEYIVERRFTEKNTTGTITVENADGLRHPSPTTLLATLIGAIAFDPMAFNRMKPREQFDMLASVVKLSINLDDMAAANKSDFTKRTDFNRIAKEKGIEADAIDVPEDLPEELIDAKVLMDAIEAAGKVNADIAARAANRTSAAERVLLLMGEAAELREQAQEREDRAKDIQKRLDEAPPLTALVDVAELRAEVDRATTVNAGIAKRARWKTLSNQAEAATIEAGKLTVAMAGRETAKREAIAAADMPVSGLGFGDGFVTLDGVPFEQASSAQRLTASMSIAMAANPKLRVIRIEDGSLLDEDAMKQIASLAETFDFQIWVERITPSSKTAIVIDDGMVKGAENAERADDPV